LDKTRNHVPRLEVHDGGDEVCYCPATQAEIHQGQEEKWLTRLEAQQVMGCMYVIRETGAWPRLVYRVINSMKSSPCTKAICIVWRWAGALA